MFKIIASPIFALRPLSALMALLTLTAWSSAAPPAWVLSAAIADSAGPVAKIAVPPDWRFDGGAAAPVKAEVGQLVYAGAYAPSLRISAAAQGGGKPAPNPGIIRQVCTGRVFNIDLKRFSALSFKARFQSKGDALPAFTVRLFSSGQHLSRSFLPQQGVPGKNGFAAFRWDYAAQLKPVSGPNRLTRIELKVDSAAFAGKDALTIDLIDFVVEGRGVRLPPVDRLSLPKWKSDSTVKYRALPVQGWRQDGAYVGDKTLIESTTATVGARVLPALRLTYLYSGDKGTVSLPFEVNAYRENVFTFLGKVEVIGPNSPTDYAQSEGFVVAMQDRYDAGWTAGDIAFDNQRVPFTTFRRNIDASQPPVDGFQTFRWDMKHFETPSNRGFDLEAVSQVKFFYDNRRVQQGQKVIVTIVDPKFVTGMRQTRDDEAEYLQFVKYLEDYHPDYSDSTKYLGPPQRGKLTTPLPLVSDGRPLGEIVGETDRGRPEGNATLELYRWLFNVTGGVPLPIGAAPGKTNNIKLFVGRTYAEKLFSADLAQLRGSDGCAIRTRGKHVYIFGATGKGTLNGVYTFLEANSDIIWPRPSVTDGAVYTDDPNLQITWGDYLHRPNARYWGWMGHESGPGFDYQVRNRANYLGLRSKVSFKAWGLYMEEGAGHNLHTFIPFSYWKTNPEYWAMRNGKREFPDGYRNQICLSNEDGKKLFIQGFVNAIYATPQAREADCYNIKIEDNWGVCECPDCLRPIRLPDGTILRKEDPSFRSTQFFMYLNAVAAVVHNNGLPNIQIGTYVYLYTVPVPKVPVTSFLRPYFCPYIRRDHKTPLFAPRNDSWWRVLNEWTQVSDRVVIREYTGLYNYLRPMAEVSAYDIRSESKAGAVEFTSEILPGSVPEEDSTNSRQFDASFMEYWLITRLYWDPDADVEQLRKYFIRRTFREAAPEMEKFYGTIRELYYAEKRPNAIFGDSLRELRLVIDKGKEPELRDLLVQAAAKAENPHSRRMIKSLQMRFDEWSDLVKKDPLAG